MKNLFKVTIGLMALQLFIPAVNAQTNFSAAEVDESSCVDYQLSVDKSDITAGKELKFTLSYASTSPLCSYEQFADENVNIDFSELASSSEDIDASYDHHLFNLNVENDGNTNISFNQAEFEEEDISSFNGDIVFNVGVDSSLSGDKVVSSNIANDIPINVVPNPLTDNTNIWSDSSYAKAGDTLQFYVRINTDAVDVDNFNGTYTIPEGLEYVDGSFKVQNNHYNDAPGLFTVENTGDTLVFQNEQPFSDMYLLSFQMNVTEDLSKYVSKFTATYENDNGLSVVNKDAYTHSYDIGGDSTVEYHNGVISKLNSRQL